MKYIQLYLLITLACVAWSKQHQVTERFPVHFQDMINIINRKAQIQKEIRNSGFDHSTLSQYSNLAQDSFVHLVNALPSIGPSGAPNVSLQCSMTLLKFYFAYSQNKTWTTQVIDSLGKPTAGIFYGSIIWAGQYRECLDSTNEDWDSKYCSLSIASKFKLGLCTPSTCTPSDVANLINFALSNVSHSLPFVIPPFSATDLTCQGPVPFDWRANIAIVVIVIILCFVFVGTIYDIYQELVKYYASQAAATTAQDDQPINNNEHEKLIPDKKAEETVPLLFQILLSFSIYTNTIKLFKITKNSDQLGCLNAIRFLSIGWVVLGHQYLAFYSYSDNIVILADWSKRVSILLVLNAFFSVDSFFLLSGFLSSYVFLKETAKRKPSVGLMVMYYLHRIWRLTPPYMLVLMLSASLSPYLGTGPFYPSGGYEVDRCKDVWYWNLLYVNNLVGTDNPCLGVSWYLGNDMQFHWIAPIVLIPLALGKRIIALGMAGLLIVVNVVTTALIINAHPGLEMGSFQTNATASMLYFNKIYITPWCRIGPFAVGLIFGYMVYIHKGKKKINSALNISLQIISIVMMGLLVFGIHPNFTDQPLSRVANILYQATSRPVWGACLGYLIYSWVLNGGIINKLLSLPFWIPLARLSFALYLIHYTLLNYFMATMEVPFHYQDSTIIVAFVGMISFSMVAAYFVSMIFEVPLIGLEKFVFKKH